MALPRCPELIIYGITMAPAHSVPETTDQARALWSADVES
jgi:hypothetical protein